MSDDLFFKAVVSRYFDCADPVERELLDSLIIFLDGKLSGKDSCVRDEFALATAVGTIQVHESEGVIDDGV